MHGIGNKNRAAITISILRRAGIVPSWLNELKKGLDKKDELIYESFLCGLNRDVEGDHCSFLIT